MMTELPQSAPTVESDAESMAIYSDGKRWLLVTSRLGYGNVRWKSTDEIVCLERIVRIVLRCCFVRLILREPDLMSRPVELRLGIELTHVECRAG